MGHIKGQHWSKEEIEAIAKVRELYTITELAEMYKTTYKTMYSLLLRHGLSHKDKEKLPEGHKRCGYCNEILPLDQFYKNNSGSNNYQSYCKNCCSIVRSQKIKKEKDKAKFNKERIAEYIEKHKNDRWICKGCGKEITIKDCKLSISRKSVSRHCNECERRRFLKRRIEGQLK